MIQKISSLDKFTYKTNYYNPIGNTRSNNYYPYYSKIPQTNKSEKINYLKSFLIGGALIAGISIATIYFKKRLATPKVKWDIQYKKDLLASIPANINVDRSNPSILESIMGKDELKNMLTRLNGELKAFVTGQRPATQRWVQDTNNLVNVSNCDYLGNLHIHTTYSDGKMTVQQLLDQAVDYANRVAQTKGKNFKFPFTIAICDHDTVEGCKKAVEIIAQNPKKYKNLRVVLGCELSTFHRDISTITNGHRTHLLVYHTNPYSDTLAQLLSQKHQRTFDTANSLIASMNREMHQHWDFKEINYTLEEAKTSNWCIRDGLNAINSPLKDYFEFRKIYHEALIHNEDLISFLKANNIPLTSISFADTCKNVTYIHKKVTDGESMPYWNKYLISLKWEILKKLHGDNFVLTKENYKSAISEVDRYFKIAEQRIPNSVERIEKAFYPLIKEEESQITDFTQALITLSKDKNISLGIAHPAFISPYHFPSSDTSKRFGFITDLFKTFKEKGGQNAMYYEKNYPYFHSDTYIKMDDEFLEFINQEANKHSLIPSGSLDNHGYNLFKTE